MSLANEDTTGALFEITGGWAAQTRWQRAGGHGFPINQQLTPEDVASKWNIISSFGTSVRCSLLPISLLLGLEEGRILTVLSPDNGRATNPSSTQEAIAQVRPTSSGHTSPLGIISRL
jgi:hypothetical protein